MSNPVFERTGEFGKDCVRCAEAGRTTGVGHGKVPTERTPEGVDVCYFCDSPEAGARE